MAVFIIANQMQLEHKYEIILLAGCRPRISTGFKGWMLQLGGEIMYWKGRSCEWSNPERLTLANCCEEEDKQSAN